MQRCLACPPVGRQVRHHMSIFHDINLYLLNRCRGYMQEDDRSVRGPYSSAWRRTWATQRGRLLAWFIGIAYSCIRGLTVTESHGKPGRFPGRATFSVTGVEATGHHMRRRTCLLGVSLVVNLKYHQDSGILHFPYYRRWIHGGLWMFGSYAVRLSCLRWPSR